jgi:hypothetical protein
MHHERKSESLLNSKLDTPKQSREGKWMKFASGKEGLAMLWDHYHCWLLVGTPDPHHKLHEYMDGDDVGWPSLSRFGWETKPIWAHFIVILFI